VCLKLLAARLSIFTRYSKLLAKVQSDYAGQTKAALERLGAWAAVARGEVPLRIVYKTGAKIEPAVKVIGVFPDNSHDPIIYPVALIADAKPDAAQYLSFLRTQTAKSVFERYGFNFLVKPTS
jgi:molybdate transport system substrate-binding protein